MSETGKQAALILRETDEPYARPLARILDDLRRPLPESMLQVRQVGGRRMRYLSTRDTIAVLDQVAPGWEGTITNLYTVRDRVVVVYRLTIHAAEGRFSREGTGSESLDASSQTADATLLAEGAALRNAASMFGLGLFL